MSFLTPNTFYWGEQLYSIATSSSTAETGPQLQFFENIPGGNYATIAYNEYSNNTVSFQAVNIPLSLSLNYPVILVSFTTSSKTASSKNHTFMFGLYSLNNGTLSLENSASANFTLDASVGGLYWISMATSKTQNITPGPWYYGFKVASGGHSGITIHGRQAFGMSNAIPGGFLMGRMTVSTTEMPVSVETSKLDITGSDAERQHYIILTS